MFGVFLFFFFRMNYLKNVCSCSWFCEVLVDLGPYLKAFRLYKANPRKPTVLGSWGSL